MPQDAPSGSVKRLTPWLLAYALPAVLFFALAGSDIRPLFVPLAGPFAARLYGHSCGVSDQGPGLTAAVSIVGGIALGLRLRWRSPWFTALLALWWFVWLALGFVSMVNANS